MGASGDAVCLSDHGHKYVGHAPGGGPLPRGARTIVLAVGLFLVIAHHHHLVDGQFAVHILTQHPAQSAQRPTLVLAHDSTASLDGENVGGQSDDSDASGGGLCGWIVTAYGGASQ